MACLVRSILLHRWKKSHLEISENPVWPALTDEWLQFHVLSDLGCAVKEEEAMPCNSSCYWTSRSKFLLGTEQDTYLTQHSGSPIKRGCSKYLTRMLKATIYVKVEHPGSLELHVHPLSAWWSKTYTRDALDDFIRSYRRIFHGTGFTRCVPSFRTGSNLGVLYTPLVGRATEIRTACIWGYVLKAFAPSQQSPTDPVLLSLVTHWYDPTLTFAVLEDIGGHENCTT